MNLDKLFSTQRVLRDRIGYEGEDRFEKLILALLVEVGELANEVRRFKFWSNNQKPRTKAVRVPSMNEEDKEYYNPTLFEYVDGLHFILETGIELKIEPLALKYANLAVWKEETITKQFIEINFKCSSLLRNRSTVTWNVLLRRFLALGEMLGFTWDEIEAAYFEKNKINHERQENGY